MAVPLAVKRASEAADAAHKEAYPQAVEEETTEQTNEQLDETVDELESFSEQVESTQESQADEFVEDEASAQPTRQRTSWKTRYEEQQRQFESEMAKLRSELAQAQAGYQGVQNVLASLKEVQQERQQEEQTPAQTAESYIKPEDIADYGEELIDMVKRAAREEFIPEITRLKEENTQLKQQVGGVTNSMVQNARTRLFDALGVEVADWQAVNKSQEFLDWLQDRDPYSGVTRHQMLMQAFEANDAARVIAFFKGFKNEQTATGVTRPQGEAQKRKPQAGLESFVAPGRPKSTPSPGGAQDQGQIWTQQEIAAFYEDVRKGKFRNSEEQKLKIEADIIAAANEGRIR